MWLELRTIFNHLSNSSPSTLAIVLSGAGPRAFTSGLDTAAFASDPNLSSSPPGDDPARKSHRLRRHIDTFQSCITAVATCSKPVIAAIHGYCYGLGIDLSLCADVRICDAQSSRFSVKEVDIGIAADIGTLSRLPKLVGNGSWVKDVCLSGRVFGPEEAMQQGLVSRVVGGGGGGSNDGIAGKEGVIRAAMEWAELVASKSPVAVQGTKEILDWSWDRSVADGLRYTSVWNSAMLQCEDVKEATMAGRLKRKPKFAKL